MTTTTTPLRAVTYCRVSTAEQAQSGLGLAAQAARIGAAITARGWEVVGEYVDAGASGATMKRRPALSEALAMLDAGQADVLVVAKLDRLSRSVIDFAGTLDRAKRKGWQLVVLDVDVDTTTPVGALMVNVLAAVAQFEREVISARTVDALQAAKRRGTRLGRPVTLAADVRARVGAERAQGMTLQAIADGLNADGVPTARGGRWASATVHRVLQSLAADVDAAA